MSSPAAIAVLVAGLVLVLVGAELFFDALLAAAARLRISAFALTVVVSGLELENLTAGIAANAKDLPGAAAGTFLGGTTFLALGVAGIGALIAPIRADLPKPVIAWLGAAPLPLLALSVDGELSRLDGVVLIAWFAVALIGMVRAGRPLLGATAASPTGSRPFMRLFAGLGILPAGGAVLADGIHRVVRDLASPRRSWATPRSRRESRRRRWRASPSRRGAAVATSRSPTSPGRSSTSPP